jgi:peptidoglycan hydrolase FlgJ
MADARLTQLDTAVNYTDLQGLGKLKEAARQQSPEAIKGVAQQFEALFVGMMLDSMRAATATLDGGLFDSQESELYQQLFDRQIAQKIANGKGLGIAAALERQLSRIAGPQAPGATHETPPAPAGRFAVPTAPLAGPGASSATATTAGRQFRSATPADFVAALLPHAERAATELGIHPLGIIAQAALETGWGQRIPARADGSSSLNLFGIKAGADWAGERASRATIEFEGGAATRRTAHFRAYEDLTHAFSDYARLLKNDPRYQAVIGSGTDPARFAERLQASGYATDPEYASKIRAILQGPTLRKVVEGAAALVATVRM